MRYVVARAIRDKHINTHTHNNYHNPRAIAHALRIKYNLEHHWILPCEPSAHMEGYSSCSVCLYVCMSVCYHTSCYIPRLYIENTVL